MNMKYKSEAKLEEATIPLLHKHFVHWSFQVPNFNRVIDFGGILKNGALVGIEYKLYDWKGAIWQAVRHRLFFDFLYILIPKRKVSQAMRIEAKKTGIGILLFDGKKIEVAIKPKFQVHQWLPKKKINILWIKTVAFHWRCQFPGSKELKELRERVKQFDNSRELVEIQS